MSNLFHWIQHVDLQLFHIINQTLHVNGLDSFFTIITDLHKFPSIRYGVLPLLMVAALWWSGRRALQAIVVLALVLGFCDLVNHRLVKPAFGRPRPFQVEEVHAQLRLPYRPGGFSFPSNHAVNGAAVATVLSAYIPPLTPILFSYAFLTGYSRPYLGVHYPSDIVVGWLMGWVVGILALGVVRRWWPAGAAAVRKKTKM